MSDKLNETDFNTCQDINSKNICLQNKNFRVSEQFKYSTNRDSITNDLFFQCLLVSGYNEIQAKEIYENKYKHNKIPSCNVLDITNPQQGKLGYNYLMQYSQKNQKIKPKLTNILPITNSSNKRCTFQDERFHSQFIKDYKAPNQLSNSKALSMGLRLLRAVPADEIISHKTFSYKKKTKKIASAAKMVKRLSSIILYQFMKDTPGSVLVDPYYTSLTKLQPPIHPIIKNLIKKNPSSSIQNKVNKPVKHFKCRFHIRGTIHGWGRLACPRFLLSKKIYSYMNQKSCLMILPPTLQPYVPKNAINVFYMNNSLRIRQNDLIVPTTEAKDFLKSASDSFFYGICMQHSSTNIGIRALAQLLYSLSIALLMYVEPVIQFESNSFVNQTRAALIGAASFAQLNQSTEQKVLITNWPLNHENTLLKLWFKTGILISQQLNLVSESYCKKISLYSLYREISYSIYKIPKLLLPFPIMELEKEETFINTISSSFFPTNKDLLNSILPFEYDKNKLQRFSTCLKKVLRKQKKGHITNVKIDHTSKSLRLLLCTKKSSQASLSLYLSYLTAHDIFLALMQPTPYLRRKHLINVLSLALASMAYGTSFNISAPGCWLNFATSGIDLEYKSYLDNLNLKSLKNEKSIIAKDYSLNFKHEINNLNCENLNDIPVNNNQLDSNQLIKNLSNKNLSYENLLNHLKKVRLINRTFTGKSSIIINKKKYKSIKNNYNHNFFNKMLKNKKKFINKSTFTKKVYISRNTSGCGILTLLFSAINDNNDSNDKTIRRLISKILPYTNESIEMDNTLLNISQTLKQDIDIPTSEWKSDLLDIESNLLFPERIRKQAQEYIDHIDAIELE